MPSHSDLRIVLHNPLAGTDTMAKLRRLLEEDGRRRRLRLVPQAG